MLHDEEFSSKAKVDRYGRRLAHTSNEKDLAKFYRLNEEELSEEDGPDDEEEVLRELRKVNEEDEDRQGSPSSSEESESEDEESEEEEVFGLERRDGGADGIPTGDVTSRLAVVNLDWDNIRSVDLMAVFSSFVPSPGRIINISIYPSDFGRERMEKEDLEGPPQEIFPAKVRNEADDRLSQENQSESEAAEDEGDDKIKKSIIQENKGIEFNSAKLRRYQLERLRYHFAIITCSSPFVAESIYTAVDGTEYLSTANFFDLRFVPDDTDFSSDRPRDECKRIPDGYRPSEFVTDALQHSKVKLTWDADDTERKEAQKRAFSGSRAAINENDLKAYLGSDSSGDEDDTAIVGGTGINGVSASENPQDSKKEAERQRMRALFGLGNDSAPSSKSRNGEKRPVGEVQVTFQSAFSEVPGKDSVFENEPERDETTMEKYIRKEKERKARRKEKMKNARNGHADDGKGGVAGVENGGADAFDDEFFDAEVSAAQHPKKKRKRSHSPPPPIELQRDIQPLPTNGDDLEDSGIRHFDAKLLAKADKMARKSSKKSKKRQHITERQKEALEARARDNFEIDIQDPRFSAVFESAEYAIDPSHKGYKETEGMRALLAEGRRKRGGEDGDGVRTEDRALDRRKEKKDKRGNVRLK